MPCVCYQQLFKEMEGREPQFKNTSDLENSLFSFSFMGKTNGKNSSLRWQLWRGPWTLPCVMLRLLMNINHIRYLQRVMRKLPRQGTSLGDVTPPRPAQRCLPHRLSCTKLPADATSGSQLAWDLLPGLMEWIVNSMDLLLFNWGKKVGTGKLGKHQLCQ